MSKKAWQKNILNFRRTPNQKRIPKETFLIICEGTKTEPYYFNSFKVKSALIKSVGLGFNTVSFVNKAIEIRKKEKDAGYAYDQIWCVFDRDNFHSNFNSAVFLAKRYGLRVAFSNESFELWYLLHFIFFDTNINRVQYIKKLKKYLPRYKKNDLDTYNKLLNYQSTAIKNSRTLINKNDLNNPNKTEPCTTVVDLVCELNKYL